MEIRTTTGDCCDVKPLLSDCGIPWSNGGCHEIPLEVPVLVCDPFSDCRRLIPFGRSSRFCSPLEPLISFTSNQVAKAISKASSIAHICCLADRNTYLILTRVCSSLSNHRIDPLNAFYRLGCLSFWSCRPRFTRFKDISR